MKYVSTDVQLEMDRAIRLYTRLLLEEVEGEIDRDSDLWPSLRRKVLNTLGDRGLTAALKASLFNRAGGTNEL